MGLIYDWKRKHWGWGVGQICDWEKRNLICEVEKIPPSLSLLKDLKRNCVIIRILKHLTRLPRYFGHILFPLF